MHERKLFLEGSWQPGEGWAEVRSPYDGRSVSRVAQAGPAQVERALAAAVAGRARLQALSTGARRAVLQAVVAGLHARAEELAGLICDEAGKPLRAARSEVQRCIQTFGFAAAELASFGGRTLPVDFDAASEGYECETRRFPAGVVVGIVPFNFPLNLGAHKVAPALAVGAPIIVKPPPQAPSAQLVLAELVQAAGADPAALQVLPCSNTEAERLATDARVRVLSFTGSAKVGWHLKARAAGKVALELGGNAAVLVCDDADLDWAAQRCALGGLSYAGQVCIKVQRIYVEAAVHEAFLERLQARVREARMGDPRDEHTVVGPVIDDASAQRIESWVKEAQDAGAKLLQGFSRDGRMVAPTLMTEVPSESRVVREEIFGPVLIVERVPDFETGLTRMNAGEYGLQAGLFTQSLRKVRAAFHGLEVGGVVVNDYPTFRTDNFPYGGVKRSGLGREGARSAMEEFTEERVLVTRSR